MNKVATWIEQHGLIIIKNWHRNHYIKYILIVSLFLISFHVFAESGNDILANTDGALTATLKGKGKEYLYITEGIASLAAYIKTKNLLFLAGIVVVALFFNGMMSIAGVS